MQIKKNIQAKEAAKTRAAAANKTKTNKNNKIITSKQDLKLCIFGPLLLFLVPRAGFLKKKTIGT